MSNYTLFILDDLVGARESVKVAINKYFPEVTVVGEAESIKEARELIPRLQPQMLMLDIQLKKGTSFDLIEGWLKESDHLPYVFTFFTAHGNTEYAVKAIKCAAIDFLNKPIDKDEFIVAINRMKRAVDEKSNLTSQMKALIQQALTPQYEMRQIFLNKIDRTTYRFLVDEIVLVRTNKGGTCNVYMKDGSVSVVNHSIGHFVELGLPDFLKVNQSAVFNTDFFEKFNAKTRVLKLTGIDEVLVVSKGQKKVVTDWINGGGNRGGWLGQFRR